MLHSVPGWIEQVFAQNLQADGMLGEELGNCNEGLHNSLYGNRDDDGRRFDHVVYDIQENPNKAANRIT